jgi:hypothetical protein
MEERRTAELMSDFDDYEIGDVLDDGALNSDDEDESGEAHKAPRKKKKSR